MPNDNFILYSLLHSHPGRVQCHNSAIEPTECLDPIYLLGLGIVSADAVRVITEAALLADVLAQGIRDDLRILSDGSGDSIYCTMACVGCMPNGRCGA